MPELPIVVAGAGLAGLALAAGLRDADLPVVVLDERPALGSVGGGITLWPNALAALDTLGLGDAVRRAGHEVPAGSIRSSSGRVLRATDPAAFERVLGGPLIAIARGDLLGLLHERADVDVLLGTAVSGYSLDGSSARVRVQTVNQSTRLRDGIDAAGLVGADGFRSQVARALGGELTESYAGYPAWRAVAPVGGFEPTEVWGRHRAFGVVPLGPDRTYWFATNREPAGGQSPGGELEHLRALFGDWPGPMRELLDATPEDTVNRVDIVDRAAPPRWVDGPVTVIGDAAHAMRPHLGQGGCQALVDAAVLAARLRVAASPAAAFASYAAARRRPALRVLRLSRQAGRLVDLTAGHRLMPLVPERVFLRSIAGIGGRRAFRP